MLNPDLDLLRKSLPGQVFLSLTKILSPLSYFDTSEQHRLSDVPFLFEHLDHNLSVLFNFINDLLYGDYDAKNAIKKRIEAGDPLVLYLRDFSLTNETYRHNETKGHSFYTIANTITGKDVPSLLSEMNSEQNFIISIRNLKGVTSRTMPMLRGELPALLLHDGNWMDIADELIQHANGIVLHLSTLGMGSFFEIECIRKHQRQNDCLLIFEHDKSIRSQDIPFIENNKAPYEGKEVLHHQLKITEDLFKEFKNHMVYTADAEWDGMIEMHQRIRSVFGNRIIFPSQKLQELVETPLRLNELFGQNMMDVLEAILENNKNILLSKPFGINNIQALYIDAALLYLSGKFLDCIEKFTIIAFYASRLLSQHKELSARITSFNIGRASASIFWIKEGVTPDEARREATELYQMLEKKY